MYHNLSAILASLRERELRTVDVAPIAHGPAAPILENPCILTR